MLYQKRTVVSESFVDQFDLVDKLLIEVQNQPSSLYTNNKRKPYAGRQKYTGAMSGGPNFASSMLGLGSSGSSVHGAPAGPVMTSSHNHFSSNVNSVAAHDARVAHYPMVFDPFAGDQTLGINGLKQSSSIWRSDDKRVVSDAIVWG